MHRFQIEMTTVLYKLNTFGKNHIFFWYIFRSLFNKIHRVNIKLTFGQLTKYIWQYAFFQRLPSYTSLSIEMHRLKIKLTTLVNVLNIFGSISKQNDNLWFQNNYLSCFSRSVGRTNGKIINQNIFYIL